MGEVKLRLNPGKMAANSTLNGQFLRRSLPLTLSCVYRDHAGMKPYIFQPRPSRPATPRHDADGCKLYAISIEAADFDTYPFLMQLGQMKSRKNLVWANTASFAIFHRGSTMDYVVLAYWGNDNELFVDVDVSEGRAWQAANGHYSFCLWDMEVLWFERNCFVQNLYTENPDMSAYRAAFFTNQGLQ